ncbi:UNVERIFIED_CONTAM: hypothetical protein K2H54_000213 [Gekko kuhli]
MPERLGLPLAEARVQIEAHYQAVSGTLNWYCVDYWSETLGLDIRALKARRLLAKIQWRPHVIPFLAALRAAGKQLVLFTNAHPASLSVKDARLGLASHLDLMRADPARRRRLRHRLSARHPEPDSCQPEQHITAFPAIRDYAELLPLAE